MDLLTTAAPAPELARAAGAPATPRIYYLSPLAAGRLDAWPPHLQRAATLGFTHLLLAPPFAARELFAVEDFERPHPCLQAGDDAALVLRRIAEMCRESGLVPLLDVMPDYVAAEGRIARERPELFRSPDPARALDPRSYAPEGEIASARYEEAAEALAAWWTERLLLWRGAGFAGFRLASLRAIPPPLLTEIARRLRADGAAALLLGWTPGLAAERMVAFAGCGLDFVFCSLPWWDFRAAWLWRELERLRRVARVIAPVEAPFGKRLAARVPDPALRELAAARAVRFAAALGDGWLMPIGVEHGARDPLDARRGPPMPPAEATAPLAEAIRRANAEALPDTPAELVTPPGAPVAALLRRDPGRSGVAVLVLTNADLAAPTPVRLASQLGAWQVGTLPARLAPGEVAMLELRETPPIMQPRPPRAQSAEDAAHAPRIAIEAVSPVVDAGRFAAKRVVGERVQVTADIFCDGHEVIAAALLWRGADETTWQRTPMRPLGNDRWAAEFTPTRVGRWLFTIEAWRDGFATYRDELGKKHAAGVDVHLELIEGRSMLADAAARVPALRPILAQLDREPPGAQVVTLLDARTAALMAEADPRPFAVRLSPPCPLDADRPRAAFGSWYELFPRSMSDDEHRHGTFRDVIRHLPRIRAMGFDVLYFPPIHPIGHTNRKGRNNALRAAPGDPGSPYAIGSEEGGHDAIHPELGTLADFHALRDAAAAMGIELALDFAVQCSPDHPWLRAHRDWFDWRPDGSLKYAENPPKKYEDIVNVDFYNPGAVPGLWVALCEVVLYWAEQGVRIFRVDNPHTKPFPFWEWMIAEVRARYPDVIFLSEAFTRPKVMARLAKLGFTQSYTYFTWRNTKRELQDYLTELTTPPMSEFFRPNFFVNTPDINPIPLQTSGRAGFLSRAALATTLAGSWGMYCGFELCEGTPLPGREEYANSEKYQLRAWDWNRPGNITAEIAQLNHIRKANPALHSHLGLTFLACPNDQILAYEKATEDRSNVVLVAVSLDPYGDQSAEIEVPLWRWGLPDHAAVLAEDLLYETETLWHGKRQYVTLTPDAPYRIWRLRPPSRGDA
jgi:starch synthase (maltosyl-transferring)